jgi:hypothetical protein
LSEENDPPFPASVPLTVTSPAISPLF